MAERYDDALFQTDAYRYDLPPELIAKDPVDPADSSRLMVVADGAIEHKTFIDFPSLLRRGDVLVVNETRVIRARLRGIREPGGGSAELLLLRPASGAPFHFGERSWLALARPGRKLRSGARVRFGDDVAHIIDVRHGGVRVVRFEDDVALETLLERYGSMPLPPYVGVGDEARDARYQTAFARVPGSVAAPTASLHFTPRVLRAVQEAGVVLAPIVLDVGLGTFRPIETASIRDHVMHAERYAIPAASADAINCAKEAGRRVVVAGTTALRATEASARRHGRVVAEEGETNIFIMPGYRFAVADALLTNFHLPASTLLVLVAAFAGRDVTLAAYREAVRVSYRFYSFGDAMFIAPSDSARRLPRARTTSLGPDRDAETLGPTSRALEEERRKKRAT